MMHGTTNIKNNVIVYQKDVNLFLGYESHYVVTYLVPLVK